METAMEAVQIFQNELTSIYESKPPVSKAKMTQVTKAALGAIKMYKHVVQSVEKFIGKCKPQYKLPGLYVIDSVVRRSRHEFGPDKDVFGPRFMRNFKQTFTNLFSNCPSDDRPKMVRVLNLWQHNGVFPAEVIQPLLDMANPNAPLTVSNSPPVDSAGSTKEFQKHLKEKFEKIKKSNKVFGSSESSSAVKKEEKRKKNLLAFDYDDDEDAGSQVGGETPTEAEPPVSEVIGREGAGNFFASEDNDQHTDIAKKISENLLMHPEIFRKLSQIQSFSQQSQQSSSTSHQQASDINNGANSISSVNNLLQSFHSAAAAQAASIETAPQLDPSQRGVQQDNYRSSRDDRRERRDSRRGDRDRDSTSRSPDLRRSRSHRQSPSSSKDNRDRRRSRSRSPRNSDDRRSRDKSSRSRRSRSRSSRSPESEEKQKERQRRHAGLPPPKSGFFTICSRTLWLGHLPKMVSEEDVTTAFKGYGNIESIELVPPRGCGYVCMTRRKDAYRILSYGSHKFNIRGSYIKMAWAPGKGVKGREYKDYWDVDLGASFLAFDLLTDTTTDLESLEEGGMMDEDSLPLPVREFRRIQREQKELFEAQQKALEELQKAKEDEESDGKNESQNNNQPNTTTVTFDPPIKITQPPPHLPGVPLIPGLALPPINFSIPPPPAPPSLNVPPPSVVTNSQPPLSIPPPINVPFNLMETLKQLGALQPPPPPPPAAQPSTSSATGLPPRIPLPPSLFGQPPPHSLNVPPPPLNVPPPQILTNRPPPPIHWAGAGPPGRQNSPNKQQQSNRPPRGTLTGANSQPLGVPNFNAGLPPPSLPPQISHDNQDNNPNVPPLGFNPPSTQVGLLPVPGVGDPNKEEPFAGLPPPLGFDRNAPPPPFPGSGPRPGLLANPPGIPVPRFEDHSGPPLGFGPPGGGRWNQGPPPQRGVWRGGRGARSGPYDRNDNQQRNRQLDRGDKPNRWGQRIKEDGKSQETSGVDDQDPSQLLLNELQDKTSSSSPTQPTRTSTDATVVTEENNS